MLNVRRVIERRFYIYFHRKFIENEYLMCVEFNQSLYLVDFQLFMSFCDIHKYS